MHSTWVPPGSPLNQRIPRVLPGNEEMYLNGPRARLCRAHLRVKALKRWCSTGGGFAPPGDIWHYLETLLVVTRQGALMASSG